MNVKHLGCLTFIFYQKSFYDKMDLRLFYFDVAKCLCRTFYITSFYEKRMDTAKD